MKTPIRLYTFYKGSEIDTCLATSFEEVFLKRPDLATWYLRSVTK